MSSNKEGEFKKRIRKLFDPRIIDGELIYLEEIVSPIGIEEIIEDARTELEKEAFFTASKTSICIEYKIWKKWFGK